MFWFRRPPAAPVFRLSPSDLAAQLAEHGRQEAARRVRLTTALLRREIAAGGLTPIRPEDVVIAEARAGMAIRKEEKTR